MLFLSLISLIIFLGITATLLLILEIIEKSEPVEDEQKDIRKE